MLEKMKRLLSAWTGRPAANAPSGSTDAVDDAGPEASSDLRADENATREDRGAWKRKALSDFESWLQDLPDTPPADLLAEGGGAAIDTDADVCDLFTLLSEFAALRQEIRMQNREQHRTIGTLTTLSGEIGNAVHAVGDMKGDHRRAIEAVDLLSRELAAAAEQMRHRFEEALVREAEKRTVLPFLDIRDALVRGRKAASDTGRTRGIFRKPPKGMAAVIEGYEMAVRRFDRALAAVGIHPVDASGKPFDPAVMRAVETCSRTDMEKGIVASEPLSGFVRGDEVIRTAEVVVNQSSGG